MYSKGLAQKMKESSSTSVPTLPPMPANLPPGGLSSGGHPPVSPIRSPGRIEDKDNNTKDHKPPASPRTWESGSYSAEIPTKGGSTTSFRLSPSVRGGTEPQPPQPQLQASASAPPRPPRAISAKRLDEVLNPKKTNGNADRRSLHQPTKDLYTSNGPINSNPTTKAESDRVGEKDNGESERDGNKSAPKDVNQPQNKQGTVKLMMMVSNSSSEPFIEKMKVYYPEILLILF